MRADSLATIEPDAPSMTVDDWHALPEDDPGELVDGRLVEEEVPDLTHEGAVMWLTEQLLSWGLPREARLFGSGAKYAVALDRGRIPDLSLFFAGRRPPARGPVVLPPDLVVEVVSSAWSDARRDRIEKFGDYAVFGVPFYWIVDPQLRTFEVWELREATYARAGAASTGEVSEIPGFAGLVLNLDALWERLAELG